MTYRYKMADVVIDISTSNQYILEPLSSYIASEAEPVGMSLDIQSVDYIDIPEGKCVFREMIVWVKKTDDSGYFGYCETDRHEVFISIDSDPEWENIKIRYVKHPFPSDNIGQELDEFCALFAGNALANHIILKNGIVLHASCISYNGKGIAFTAPSGTGKSTHTQLWEKYMPGTVVLNDDTPVIRFAGNKPIIYGTPWSGSQFKNTNASSPLSAIVILERSQQNSIRQVDSGEAVAGLMPRLLLPYFDQSLMDLSIDTLDKIIKQVPVYHLKCRPDVEAVELVHKCIS